MRRLVIALTLLTTSVVLVGQEHPAAPAESHQSTAAEHGGGHDDLGTWKWVNFGILAALLGWAIATHAGPFFDGRIADIQKEINEAKQVRNEAEARATAIEVRLSSLDLELAQMRTCAKSEMEAEAARIQDETKRATARAGEQAQQEIAAMSKAAENELRHEASRLALALAETKLKSRMSPANEGSLVARFVAGLRATSQN